MFEILETILHFKSRFVPKERYRQTLLDTQLIVHFRKDFIAKISKNIVKLVLIRFFFLENDRNNIKYILGHYRQ